MVTMGSYFVRGSTVVWAVTFYDQLGGVVTPASATLNLSYRRGGVLVSDTIAMTQGLTSDWSADWDSAVSDPGNVFWHVRSAGARHAALEGTIVLEINPANPST